MSDLIDEGTMVQAKFQEITNRVKYSDYIMPYGKYRGEFLADIKIEDPNYFDWLAERARGELKEAMDYHMKGD